MFQHLKGVSLRSQNPQVLIRKIRLLLNTVFYSVVRYTLFENYLDVGLNLEGNRKRMINDVFMYANVCM